MTNEKNYPVTRSFLPPMAEFVHELEAIWETHWLTNQGVLHQKLATELASYLKTENVTLFTNGHLALDIAIKGLGLTGEVITTPFSFASTTHAIVMNGLTPVFCDIKPEDYTIDEKRIEDLITPRTSAIIAVHVYGNPCAIETIGEIAKRHSIKVIYDAAHAFGESVGGLPIAGFGDVSMFSFHATKVFHTIEGGALAYSDEALRRSFDLYKNFGITGPETVEAVGLNAKMNEFQAAMGLVNLRYIDQEIALRQAVCENYDRCLANVPGIELLQRRKDVRYNYSYYPIVVHEDAFSKNRDALYDDLTRHGVFPRKYFYPLIADFDCYKGKYDGVDVGIARSIAARVLTLPLYSSLSEDDVAYISETIRMASRGSALGEG